MMPFSEKTCFRLLGAILLLTSGAYLLQIRSPLRLNVDAVYILEVASSIADGNGIITLEGETSRYPPGYPAMLALLEVTGLGASWAFITLNCLFIALGMIASYFVFRQTFDLDPLVALLLCSLTLLSYVMVKHVTLALTDVSFFGMAMTTMLVLSSTRNAQSSRRWWLLLLLAIVLTTLSIFIRAIGVAFIPALGWALFTRMRRGGNMGKLRIGLLILALGIIIALFFGPWNQLNLSLVADAFTSLVRESGDALFYIFVVKPLAWGEVFLNVPRTQIPLDWRLTLPVFLLAGYAGILTVLYAIWQRRRQFGPIEIVMLIYMGIMIIWYGINARFWLPVLPLILGLLTHVVKERLQRKIVRRAVALYLIWFMFAGSAALVYSSRISLASPAEFADSFSGGGMGATYALAFKNEDPKGKSIGRRAFAMLLRYEDRIHPHFKTQEEPWERRR